MAIFTVNTTDDVNNGVCNASHCSLREAILATNTNGSGQVDEIHFNIPGGGVKTITPATPLPAITTSTIVNGLTQPGASCAAWPPTLLIELSGANAGTDATGLVVDGGPSAIRGLVINRFGYAGIVLGTNHSTVTCNYIGTNPAGDAAGPGNGGPSGFGGIYMNGREGNFIGGSGVSSRNLISGNKPYGVYIYYGGTAANPNRVQNNYIGTNAANNAAIPSGVNSALHEALNFLVIVHWGGVLTAFL